MVLRDSGAQPGPIRVGLIRVGPILGPVRVGLIRVLATRVGAIRGPHPRLHDSYVTSCHLHS